MKEPHLSTPASPGFAILQNEENGYFYFQCNDLMGKSILQSKDFQTQKAAETGLQNALRFAKHAKNYVRKNEGEQHFFILNNSKPQELAKSVRFDTEKDLQNAMNYLQQLANVTKSAEKENVEEPSASLVSSAAKSKPQAKYSFKIDLHFRNEEATFSGKIENLVTQESSKFQGIDGRAIAAFIQQQVSVEKEVVTPQRKPPTGQATLQLSATPQGVPVRSIATGSPLLYFQLQPSQPTAADQEWTLVINARPVGTSTPLVRTERKTKANATGTLPLALPGDYFQEGLYRLEVAANTAGQRLEAQCMFQVY